MGAPAKFPIIQLIPNLVTIIAIVAGLTAIRYGLEGDFERAVKLILLAAVLDGIDGALARMLKSESKVGAELDSLADFLNFGVAPPMIMYFWALQEAKGLGWIAVLVFSIASVLRLARFNVSAKSDDEPDTKGYYIGIPSPAGALLVMMPMFITFAIEVGPFLPPLAVSAYVALVGLGLISRIPTWSIKAVHISREYVKFLVLGLVFVGAAVMSFPWVTLFAIGLGYIGIVGWCISTRRAPDLSKPE
ncbi:MAG: CDP-diacylglycerol--serine O-phosphatidyltransferase [Rhodobacteraceae bacterium]|nr:CDP-diacylglycerol--serine O-phosphatidyltransferase [Paracoccaceae bacterium]